jgi:hypothetical protein
VLVDQVLLDDDGVDDQVGGVGGGVEDRPAGSLGLGQVGFPGHGGVDLASDEGRTGKAVVHGNHLHVVLREADGAQALQKHEVGHRTDGDGHALALDVG